MKKIISCIALILCIAMNVNAQNAVAHKSTTPFQGTKEFCEFYQKSKYVVTLKNSSVLIKYIYIKKSDTTTITGKIINGKVYTNDPDEKANKSFAGKYYLLTRNTIRILNGENGDYAEYDLCK